LYKFRGQKATLGLQISQPSWFIWSMHSFIVTKHMLPEQRSWPKKLACRSLFIAAGLGKQDSYAQLVSTESAVSLLGLWGMRGPYSLQNLSKSWSAQVSNLIVGRGTMVTMATIQLDYNQRLWAFRLKKALSMGSFLIERILWSAPNRVPTAPSYWVTARFGTEAFSSYHLCSTYRRMWGLLIVRLLWLSVRALVAQTRVVVGLTFHFPLFAS